MLKVTKTKFIQCCVLTTTNNLMILDLEEKDAVINKSIEFEKEEISDDFWEVETKKIIIKGIVLHVNEFKSFIVHKPNMDIFGYANYKGYKREFDYFWTEEGLKTFEDVEEEYRIEIGTRSIE